MNFRLFSLIVGRFGSPFYQPPVSSFRQAHWGLIDRRSRPETGGRQPRKKKHHRRRAHFPVAHREFQTRISTKNTPALVPLARVLHFYSTGSI